MNSEKNESFPKNIKKLTITTPKKKFISFMPRNQKPETRSFHESGMTSSQPLDLEKRVKTAQVSPRNRQLSKKSLSKKEVKLSRIYTKSFKTSSQVTPLVDNELKLKNFAMVKSFVDQNTRRSAPINLLNHIKVLIRAANILRFRTKFRGLRFINEQQVGLIDDQCYFPGRMQKDYFLKRFTEKSVIKKCYYTMMSWIFSNIVLTFLRDKYDKVCKFFDANTPVIKPFQKGKVLWDVLILLTIVSFFFIIPLQLSFGFNYEEELHEFFEIHEIHKNISGFLIMIPELLLIMDSLLKFITGFYENGLVIIDKTEIVHHYLRKGLIFDLLSYCPIILQSLMHNTSLGLKILQLLVFCKLKRVQLIMNNFREMISLNGKNDYILGLIILTFEIIFFCHINACVWHSVAYYYPIEGNTWLDYSHVKNFPWSTKYYYSLFWAVSVMVTIGFGEKVSPQNNTELMIAVLIFLSSALFFGYTINCMREIFDEMAKHEREYKECLSVINQYMNSKNINFELQGRVRKYLEYIMHKETNIEKENEILNKLTMALKREVILESNGKLIYEIPLFNKNFSAKTLEQLAFSLKQIRYSPEEYIYHINDIDDCSLYIVAKGDIEMVYEKERSIKGAHIFKRGEIFGIRSFFTDDPREISIRSRNFSTLFEIKQTEFLKIIKKHPEDYERYLSMKDQIKLYGNYDNSDLKCMCCSKKTHLYHQCPLIHFIPDRDFVIKRSLCSKKQDRTTSFHRKARKKYHARANLNLVQSAILFLASSVFSGGEDLEDSVPLDDPQKHSTQQLIMIPSEEDSKQENPETSELEMSPRNKRVALSKEESSSPSQKKEKISITLMKKFPSKDEQTLIDKPEEITRTESKGPLRESPEGIKRIDSKGIGWAQLRTNPKFSTDENLGKGIIGLGKYEEPVNIPSQSKFRRGLLKKKTTKIYEKEGEVKEIPYEKYVEYHNNRMFHYDFETMKNYNVYSTQNNFRNVLEKIYEKQISPASFGSKRSNKKKAIEKRIRSSKFMLDHVLLMNSRHGSEPKDFVLFNNSLNKKIASN